MHPRWSKILSINHKSSTSHIRNNMPLERVEQVKPPATSQATTSITITSIQHRKKKENTSIHSNDTPELVERNKVQQPKQSPGLPPAVLICVSGIGSAKKRLRDSLFNFIGFIQEPALPKLGEFHHIPRRAPA